MTLRLREWKRKDAPALVLLANNKLVSEKLRDRFPFPYKLKDADRWIASTRKANPISHFAIESDNILVGGCGFQLQEDIYKATAEIGYWLGVPFWERGIATEAIRQLLLKIDSDFPELIRLYAEVFLSNPASARVLINNGFYLESTRTKSVTKNNIVQDDQVWVKIIR